MISNSNSPKNKPMGHYSLFGGFQVINESPKDYTLKEINNDVKFVLSRNTIGPQGNESRFVKKVSPPREASLIDIYNTSIITVDQLMDIANKQIQKIQERAAKSLQKIRSTSSAKKALSSAKNKIAEIQKLTDNQINTIKSLITKENAKKAQSLIKKIQSRATSQISKIKKSPEVRRLLKQISTKIKVVKAGVRSPSKLSVKSTLKKMKAIVKKSSKKISISPKVKAALKKLSPKVINYLKKLDSKKLTPKQKAYLKKFSPSVLRAVRKLSTKQLKKLSSSVKSSSKKLLSSVKSSSKKSLSPKVKAALKKLSPKVINYLKKLDSKKLTPKQKAYLKKFSPSVLHAVRKLSTKELRKLSSSVKSSVKSSSKKSVSSVKSTLKKLSKISPKLSPKLALQKSEQLVKKLSKNTKNQLKKLDTKVINYIRKLDFKKLTPKQKAYLDDLPKSVVRSVRALSPRSIQYLKNPSLKVRDTLRTVSPKALQIIKKYDSKVINYIKKLDFKKLTSKQKDYLNELPPSVIHAVRTLPSDIIKTVKTTKNLSKLLTTPKSSSVSSPKFTPIITLQALNPINYIPKVLNPFTFFQSSPPPTPKKKKGKKERFTNLENLFFLNPSIENFENSDEIVSKLMTEIDSKLVTITDTSTNLLTKKVNNNPKEKEIMSNLLKEISNLQKKLYNNLDNVQDVETLQQIAKYNTKIELIKNNLSKETKKILEASIVAKKARDEVKKVVKQKIDDFKKSSSFKKAQNIIKTNKRESSPTLIKAKKLIMDKINAIKNSYELRDTVSIINEELKKIKKAKAKVEKAQSSPTILNTITSVIPSIPSIFKLPTFFQESPKVKESVNASQHKKIIKEIKTEIKKEASDSIFKITDSTENNLKKLSNVTTNFINNITGLSNETVKDLNRNSGKYIKKLSNVSSDSLKILSKDANKNIKEISDLSNKSMKDATQNIKEIADLSKASMKELINMLARQKASPTSITVSPVINISPQSTPKSEYSKMPPDLQKIMRETQPINEKPPTISTVPTNELDKQSISLVPENQPSESQPSESFNGTGFFGFIDRAFGAPMSTGPRGPQGYKGDKGDQGERGLKGDEGEKGEKGDRGQKGEKGDKGLDGKSLTWDILTPFQKSLIKGDRGDRGFLGAMGPKGDKGDTGDALTWDKLTPSQKLSLMGSRGPVGPQGNMGPQGPKGDRGERGPMGRDSQISKLQIDSNEIRIRSKDQGTLIEKTIDGLGLYSGFDKVNDSQIQLGRDLILRNKNNNVFTADGKDVTIGSGKNIMLNGLIEKVRTSVVDADKIKLGDNKKLLLTDDNENNFLTSNKFTTELHAHPNYGWKFIKNTKGKRDVVMDINNNKEAKPEITMNADIKIKGKAQIDDLYITKYNFKDDKNKDGAISFSDGKLLFSSPQGIAINDFITKNKFLDLTFDGKKKRGLVNFLNSDVSVNNLVTISSEDDGIYVHNKYKEKVQFIPNIRKIKLNASGIVASSIYPGQPMINCTTGDVKKTLCSTNKSNGKREFVKFKLPERKLIDNIKLYNRIDANMDKIQDVEIFVTDINNIETFRTKITSIQDFYIIPINAYGTSVTMQHSKPNTVINIRGIRIYSRNVI